MLKNVLCSNIVDDEEEMLYGDSNTSATPSKDEMSRSFGAPGPSVSEGSSSKAEPSHWCMITRENGVMEVRVAVSRCASSSVLFLYFFLSI